MREQEEQSVENSTQMDSREIEFRCKKAELVRRFIENCLQMYLSKSETVEYVARATNIGPDVISRVWEVLEEQNAAFFKCYDVRLKLMMQIKTFNQLLEKQDSLTNDLQLQNIMQPALHSGLQHMPGDLHFPGINSHRVYPAQQLPYVPSAHPTFMESTYSQPVNPYISPVQQLPYTPSAHPTLIEPTYNQPVYGKTDEVPVEGNFLPIQQNIYGTFGFDQEMARIFPPNDFSCQPPLTLDAPIQMNAAPVGLNTIFSTDQLNIQGPQLPQNGGRENPWVSGGNLSFNYDFRTDSINLGAGLDSIKFLMGDMASFEDAASLGNIQHSVPALFNASNLLDRQSVLPPLHSDNSLYYFDDHNKVNRYVPGGPGPGFHMPNNEN